MHVIPRPLSATLVGRVQMLEAMMARPAPRLPGHVHGVPTIARPHLRNGDIPAQAAKCQKGPQSTHGDCSPPSRFIPTVITRHSAPRVPAPRYAASHRADFQALAGSMGLDPSRLTVDELQKARDRYHFTANTPPFTRPGAAAGRRTLRTLASGMGMEALRRPGFWNDGAFDVIVPSIVKCDAWPAGRPLRIVDYDSNSIHFYSQEAGCWTYTDSGTSQLLPEPSVGEILLIRQNGHFMRVDPDSEQLIHDVPRDGDCFFSCISTALGHADNARPAFNLQLRDSVARYIESDPGLLETATVCDLPPRGG